MRLAFLTFRNRNETLVYQGMVGNGDDFKEYSLLWNFIPKQRGTIVNPKFATSLFNMVPTPPFLNNVKKGAFVGDGSPRN